MASVLEKSYRMQAGEYGSRVIVQHGRCTSNHAKSILDGVSDGVLEPIPNARGGVFKSMDGTNPVIYLIEPSTMGGIKFKCVKRSATTQPLAPTQSAGAFSGYEVLTYEIVWQEVGALVI